MYRRTLLLCGLATLLPAIVFPAIAQTGTQPPRVVMILYGPDPKAGPFVESFLDGMHQAGRVQGRTVQIDVRYAQPAGMRALINETIAQSPAVLVVAVPHNPAGNRTRRFMTSTWQAAVRRAGYLSSDES